MTGLAMRSGTQMGSKTSSWCDACGAEKVSMRTYSWGIWNKSCDLIDLCEACENKVQQFLEGMLLYKVAPQ